MGVPLRRPATAASDLFVPDVFAPIWLDVFRFCSVKTLGSCLAVSKSWNAVADDSHVWIDTYERTQWVDSTSEPMGEGSLRALIQRPFGEEAAGWRVAVLLEDGSNRHASGHIVAYNGDLDAYLVNYDGEDGLMPPGERWEQERRKRTAAMRHNPSLAGKSRFSFLSPPLRTWPSLPDEEHHGGSSGSNAAPRSGPLLRYKSWKQELESNVRNAPSRLLHRIEEHTDEVLFVVFSPCGTRLASCSRDLRTAVFRVVPARSRQSASSESGCAREAERCGESGDRESDPTFVLEATFTHLTAPCRALWWPIEPYTLVAVSTEEAGWQGASKVEIWEIQTKDGGSDDGVPPRPHPPHDEEILPVGLNSRCIFQGHNRPFDIYAGILHWPPRVEESPAQELPSPVDLCFLSGFSVLRENDHYVQWLNVWPGPRHPKFREGIETGRQVGGQAGEPTEPMAPLARLRLEGDMNYLHCLEVGPGTQSQRILAMTGSTPHLCDTIGLIDMKELQQRDELDVLEASILHYDAPVQVRPMGGRVVLSAKWNRRGDLIILNTRPYVRQTNGSRSPHTPASPGGWATANASFEDLLQRPAPDLSTSMELLVLDARSLAVIGLLDGHFAFTTKESPFLIFTDEWIDSDFLASGGEDHRVYVWHRRHRRLIRRLCGHTEPVNAVSWNGSRLLASGSDDHSIIIWACGSAHSDSSDIGESL
jgi:hypothetical protein